MLGWLFSIVVLIIISLLVYFEHKNKIISKNFHWIKWILQNIKFTLDYWGFKKKYSDATSVVFRAASLSKAMSLEDKDPKELRDKIADLVVDVHSSFFPNDNLDSLEKDSLAATYMAIIHYPEIRSVLESLSKDHSSLEVRKATNVAIDVIGELLNLGDKLGQDYFQHLIYGINKALVLIKKKGTDKDVLKKVTSTLFRVYKLTRAYSRLRSLEGMTEDEFYKQVRKVMDSVIGSYWERKLGLG